MLMVKIVLGLVGAVILIGGAYYFLHGSDAPLGAFERPIGSEQTTATTTQNSVATTTTQTTPGQPSTTNPKKAMTATLQTNMGTITIEFYGDKAPQTVANFAKLAGQGYYDGTKFHRVIKGFMDQAGDPLTKDDSKQAQWGTGGPGYTIPDEIDKSLTNTAGTVAMANTGRPNSGGSQFFINAVDNHFLDGNYTVFGKVTSGMDVVTAINNVKTDGNDRPLTPVILQKVTVQ
jgi:cyclophilin family peptidyl-prolyl cis-trans isomerase